MSRLPGRREIHIHRFAVDSDVHPLVRATLAAYLGREPATLAFVRTPHGKPFLAGERELRFSVSRSQGLAVLGVARGADLGVDVERHDRALALGPIADALFADEEAAELSALAEDRRISRFFELWTRKEAVAKALGVGLAMPLRLLRAPAGWQLDDLSLGPEVSGAVCVRGRRRVVLCS
jgi:phosphopantetheinyl transferase